MADSDPPRPHHDAWYKDVPEMAAKLCVPPAKGTKAYNRAAALSNDVQAITPPPFDPATAIDPFGALLDAELRIQLKEGRRRGNFADTIDDFDPNDPMRAAWRAFHHVCRAIVAFGTEVEVVDEGVRQHNQDLAKYGVAPLPERTARSVVDGYNVDVSALCSGRNELQRIEEGLDTIDIRRKAIWAIRNLVQACLFSVSQHLGADHEGEVFHFVFDKVDPKKFRYSHEPAH